MGNGEGGMGNGEWGMGNREWGIGNREWGIGNREWAIGVNLSCQPAKFVGHPASPTGVETPVS